jgi:hypothetical protein
MTNPRICNEPLLVPADTSNTAYAAQVAYVQSYVAAAITTVAATNGSNATGTWPISVTGNAATASALASGVTIPVANGGTGLTSLTAGNYLNAASSTTLQQRTPAQVLSDIGALATTGTAAKATNVAGGGANQLVIQSAAGVTTFVSSANSSVLVTNSAGAPTWNTALPQNFFVPNPLNSVATNVTATGTTQSGAAILRGDYNVVKTVPAGSGVVLLAALMGLYVTVLNLGANPLLVYPTSGQTIDGQAVNLPVTVPVNGIMTFQATTAAGTAWYTTSNFAVNASALLGSVALTQIAQLPTTTLIGNGLATTGPAAAITLGAGLTLSTSNVLSATGVSSTGTLAGGAAGQVLYQSAANTTAFATAANNAVLVSSSSGVPAMSTTLPSGLTIPGRLSSVAPAVSANALTQSGGTPLTADYNVVTTASVTNNAVVLPASQVGNHVVVINNSGFAIQVFPQNGTSNKIDQLAANAGILLPINGWLEVDGVSATQWFSTLNASVNTSVLTGSIALTQIATIATKTLLANATAGTAAPTAVSLAASLTFTGTTLAVSNPMPSSYIDGALLSWNSVTSISVGTGNVYNPGLGGFQAITTAIASTLSGLSANTIYHVYLTGTLAAPTVTVSATPPAAPYSGTARTMTSNTSARYLGSIAIGATANNALSFLMTSQNAILYREKVANQRLLAGGVATTPTNVSLATLVPTTAQSVQMDFGNASTTITLSITTADMNFSAGTAGWINIGIAVAQVATIPYPSNGNVEYSYASTTTNGAYIDVMGYTFGR